MRFATALVLGLSLAVGPTGTARQGQPAPQAVFRVGVDVVQLDVLVLDRNRRPVRGLTAADFTILERGNPQSLLAFSEVNVPEPVAPAAPWLRDVGPDVTSNDLRTRRLIIVFMDDALTGIDEGEPRLVQQVARSIVDQLGPADLAAVVFSYQGRFQNFTADRAQLLAAIDSFRPRNWGVGVPLGCALRVGGCSLDSLARVGEVLLTAPPGRKVIMYVGPGITINTAMTNPDLQLATGRAGDMVRYLHEANTSIYTFDPRGVMVTLKQPEDTALVSLADSTGGRDIRNTNDPAAHVPEVFRENSSYYLLGYQSTDAARDGRFRNVEVKVNRPGLEARTRSGYYARKSAPPKASATASALDTAVLRGMPSGDLPLRIAAAPFRAGRNGAEVAIVAAVREPAVPAGPSERPGSTSLRRVNVVATAFDSNWRSVGAYRQTLQLTVKGVPQADDSEYEVVSRLALKPGRYEVRFGAESGGRAGSVFASLDVPDFAKERLSLSGVIVERTPGRLIVPADPLKGLASAVPTSVREFDRRDRVSWFVRVYQGGSDALKPVSATWAIVDDANRTVIQGRSALEPGQFDASRAGDYRHPLSLDGLRSGEYLLTVEASVPGRTVRRDMRFSVR